MKNFLWILGLVSIFTFTGCSSDETNLNNDCIVCTTENGDEITYCYNGKGHSYWVQVNNEDPYVLPLGLDQTWEEFKTAHPDCLDLNPGETDCFDCVQGDETTTYCFTQGNDYYTYTIDGETTQVFLGNQTWVEIRSELLVLCDDSQTDCFDCTTAAGVTYTYCYTSGNTYYTRTLDGETTNIDLATQSWEEVRLSLQTNNCE